MASRTPAPCCRIASAILMAAALSLARAETIPQAGPASLAATHLYLEVILNETVVAEPVSFEYRDGRLHATVDTLRGLGFQLDGRDGDAPVPLDALPGVRVRYDPSRQSVRIDAPLDILALSSTDLGLPANEIAVVTDHAPGVLLNYDLYGSDGDGGWNLTGFGELRAFGLGRAVASTTGITRTFQREGGRRQHDSTRLDTRLQWSFPGAAVSVIAGDAFTGFLDWTRPVRIGGVQVGRNFALQPYRVTVPLPEFLGEAAVPSEVELYVNGLRQYSGSTPTGPFRLAPVPGVTGAGNAQVVITDAYGRVNTLDFPFYATQRLLAPGLSDWSLALGWVREQYGLRSFEYADALVGSGTWRYGATPRLTVEAHAEGGGGLTSVGVGGAYLLGMAGVVNAAHARSRDRHRQGGQSTLGWSWNNDRYQLAADTRRTHDDYRDIAALYGPPPPPRSDRATAGVSTGAGNFGLTYVRLDQVLPHREDDAPFARIERGRYAGLYWSHAFGSGWYANAAINQNLDTRADRSAYAGLMIPLGRQRERQAALSWQRDGDLDSAVVDVAQPVPGDGGVGWRVQARSGDASGGLAEGAWLGPRGRVGAGVSRFGDSRFAYAQAAGSLVRMGGGWFAAREIVDAFAVVSTDGIPGIPVALENRPIGLTDSRGLLLVTPLNAWQRNRLSIDPMDLPADIRVTDAARVVTPADRAGVRVGFEVRRVRGVRLLLHDTDDVPLPPGSRIEHGAGTTPGIVGHGGQAYLESPAAGSLLRIRLPDGDVCTTLLPALPEHDPLQRLGPLRCEHEARR